MLQHSRGRAAIARALRPRQWARTMQHNERPYVPGETSDRFANESGRRMTRGSLKKVGQSARILGSALPRVNFAVATLDPIHSTRSAVASDSQGAVVEKGQ